MCIALHGLDCYKIAAFCIICSMQRVHGQVDVQTAGRQMKIYIFYLLAGQTNYLGWYWAIWLWLYIQAITFENGTAESLRYAIMFGVWKYIYSPFNTHRQTITCVPSIYVSFLLLFFGGRTYYRLCDLAIAETIYTAKRHICLIWITILPKLTNISDKHSFFIGEIFPKI